MMTMMMVCPMEMKTIITIRMVIKLLRKFKILKMINFVLLMLLKVVKIKTIPVYSIPKMIRRIVNINRLALKNVVEQKEVGSKKISTLIALSQK